MTNGWYNEGGRHREAYYRGRQNKAKSATKTWKIGEYARGGVITAKVNGTKATVIGKEWDFSAGSTRGSNQSNAQEFTRVTADVSRDGDYQLENFLNRLTTPYYTGQIMDWIREKTQ